MALIGDWTPRRAEGEGGCTQPAGHSTVLVLVLVAVRVRDLDSPMQTCIPLWVLRGCCNAQNTPWDEGEIYFPWGDQSCIC